MLWCNKSVTSQNFSLRKATDFRQYLKNAITFWNVQRTGWCYCIPYLYLRSIHKYLRQFRYSYWWRARHVGVFKPLIMTSVYNRLSALVLMQDVSCYGRCRRCRWVGRAVCERKTSEYAPRLYAHAHKRNRKTHTYGRRTCACNMYTDYTMEVETYRAQALGTSGLNPPRPGSW